MSVLGQVRQWIQDELEPIYRRLEALEKAVESVGDGSSTPAADQQQQSTTAKAAPARGRGSAGRAKVEATQPDESSGASSKGE